MHHDQLADLGNRHLWGHFSTVGGGIDNVRIMERGDGCYIWDDEGKRYLDGLAGLFTVQVGHGRSELAEAARVDGARPMRFFFDIILPMSRTNIAALFVILFIYGWNQYLWPLLITTDPDMNTIVMGLKQMFPSGDDTADWPVIMATSILAMIPPVIVVISMQRLFIRGLVDSEK